MFLARWWMAAWAILPATSLAQEIPSSTETGQSPLDESFGRARDVREAKAWEDTRFDVRLRTYDFDRDNFDGSEDEALAIGGHAGFKTGYFRERFAFGATGYTSQRIYGPEDKDGTGLLAPGQEGYTVVGELFGELLLGEGTRLTIGRRGIDTPFLNRNDSRMSPNTFEAIALQGLYGGGEGEAEWRAGAGYFDEIKLRNSDEFVSMATAAGAPAGVERGVYVAGANYRKGDVSIGAIDYYSDDIINIFYTEAKYALQLGKDRRLQFALQYSDQQGVGENLLGRGFLVGTAGRQGRARHGRSPVHRGLHECERRQRHALTLGQLSRLHARAGLRLQPRWRRCLDAPRRLQLHSRSRDSAPTPSGSMARDPQDPAQFARDEYNLNLEWSPDSGPLKGLMLRLRFAHVTQDGPGNTDQDELRLMAFYDPPSL